MSMFRTFMYRCKTITERLVDIIFPRTCLGCGVANYSICNRCLSKVPAPNENLPDWIDAVFTYRNPLIKTAIWKLKYNNNYDAGKILGKHLYAFLLEQLHEKLPFERPPFYLIPIPISSKRFRERGYNQASIIVSAILCEDKIGIFADGSHFIAKKDTEQRQSHTKNKNARLHNIRGSFIPAQNLPPRAHCILIDDVVTTGATLVEARNVLIAMGAKKVNAYTIAH